MNAQDKSKEELIQELSKLQQENRLLKIELKENIAQRNLAHNKFQILFEESPVGMALVLHETGKFLEVNNSILKSTGYTKKEFLELSYWDLTPRKYEQQEIKQIQTLNESGRFGPNFKEYIRKDGSRYPLSISGFLFIDTQGRKVVWGIIEDLSMRKRREQIIKEQNEELQQLNAGKDKLLSIIAHDLKNSFNAVIGFSNLLLDQIENKDTAEIDDYAQIINQASNQALDLLINLLEWSQLQTGIIKYNPKYFKINTIIDNAMQLMKVNAEQKSINISCNHSCSIQVYADKHMLNTVLRNLISNAIKFTQPNGKIAITSTAKQNELTVSVVDNGVGIPAEEIDKLFTIEKVKTTKGTQNEEGTGLGLTLCREFIEKHNGKIWAESTVNKGSAFHFCIPLPQQN